MDHQSCSTSILCVQTHCKMYVSHINCSTQMHDVCFVQDVHIIPRVLTPLRSSGARLQTSARARTCCLSLTSPTRYSFLWRFTFLWSSQHLSAYSSIACAQDSHMASMTSASVILSSHAHVPQHTVTKHNPLLGALM